MVWSNTALLQFQSDPQDFDLTIQKIVITNSSGATNTYTLSIVRGADGFIMPISPVNMSLPDKTPYYDAGYELETGDTIRIMGSGSFDYYIYYLQS